MQGFSYENQRMLLSDLMKLVTDVLSDLESESMDEFCILNA